MRMLEIPSGARFERPAERLRAFCSEEYDYYDAVASIDEDTKQPIDVLVTVAVNSFITNAAQARTIHRGLATACDPILHSIPASADLLKFEPLSAR
jgi:hypothetical protein